jgi:Flp pilus assembly protein TadG
MRPGTRLRRPRGRDESGVAAVEAALVFPLVLLITFGIIEFSFLLRDYIGASQAARDSVRTASAAPQQGGTGSVADVVAGHRGTAAPSFAFQSSEIVTGGSTAVPPSSFVDMWVYLANRNGFPAQSVNGWRTDSTSDFSSCPPSTCVRYAFEVNDVAPELSTFEYRSGQWDPATINACAGSDDAMAVGVLVRVRHSGPFSALFGTAMTLNDSAVAKFEPLRNVRCQGSLP